LAKWKYDGSSTLQVEFTWDSWSLEFGFMEPGIWIHGTWDSATFRHLSLASHSAPIPGEVEAAASRYRAERGFGMEVRWGGGNAAGER
jgi:hypothetical protein